LPGLGELGKSVLVVERRKPVGGVSVHTGTSLAISKPRRLERIGPAPLQQMLAPRIEPDGMGVTVAYRWRCFAKMSDYKR
jgi:hypothetical protein